MQATTHNRSAESDAGKIGRKAVFVKRRRRETANEPKKKKQLKLFVKLGFK